MGEFRLGDCAILALDRCRNARRIGLQAFDPCPSHDRHALLGQRLFQKGRDIGVLDRHDAVKHLNDSHLCAHVIVETRKLDANRTGPNDEQLFRHFGRHHRVAIGPDALSIGRRERQIPRPRAGGDDDVLRGELFGLAILGDGQCVRGGQLALAHMDGDLVFLH